MRTLWTRLLLFATCATCTITPGMVLLVSRQAVAEEPMAVEEPMNGAQTPVAKYVWVYTQPPSSVGSLDPAIKAYRIPNGSLLGNGSIAVAVCAAFAGIAQAAPGFVVESLDGDVTPHEIDAFNREVSGYAPDNFNWGNAMATHKSGTIIAGISKAYEAIRDVRILNNAVRFADVFVAYRNDEPKGSHIVQWTGNIEPVWPMKPDSKDAGAESGAVAGHIAYVAFLMLDSPTIWNNTIPDGDPYGYGATYKARALTYLARVDESLNKYITRYCVDPATFKIKNPSLNPQTGSEMPWNVQVMFMLPHLYSARCHDILGDKPAHLALCKAVVNKYATWFVASGDYYTTADGRKVVKWYYMPPNSHAIENQGHAQHDLRGLIDAYESGYTMVTPEQMKIYADTARYAMYRSDKKAWSDNVGGTGSDFHIKPDFLPLAQWNRPLYKLMAESILRDNRISSGSETCITAGFLLYMKHWMFTHPSKEIDQ